MIFATTVALTVFYVMLMYVYRAGWQQRSGNRGHERNEGVSISVIIPARNEEANIGACIDAILAQSYPMDKVEVIVIDDHSQDRTAEIVSSYAGRNVTCLSLERELAGKQINSYKKAALSLGIAAAKGELIVTTDADCIAGPDWLASLAGTYSATKPVMIVAPVMYDHGKSILHIFQSIDFMAMQGITAAAHSLGLGHMSNGANLAFSRDACLQVEGYKGIDHLASGDDYLLMVKMARAFPGRIAYLGTPEAIVTTASQPTWRSFLNQRVRWASKSGKYNDARLTMILLLVYAFNVLLLGLAAGAFFSVFCGMMLAAALSAKVIAELYFLMPVARFFNRQQMLWYHPLLQPLHVLYIVAAGFLGFAGGYSWKGRRVR